MRAMKERYRLFLRRKSVYYAFDNTTKTFESLKTKDKAEASRLTVALYVRNSDKHPDRLTKLIATAGAVDVDDPAHRAQRAHDVARQPHFTVRPAPYGPEQCVVGDDGRRRHGFTGQRSF